jgi:hypothetical protein
VSGSTASSGTFRQCDCGSAIVGENDLIGGERELKPPPAAVP